MYLHSLEVHNFRNYQYQFFNELEQLNIFYGANGVGKTNILEAIGYLGTLQSPRISQSRELIMWGENYYKISANVQNDTGTYSIKLKGSQNGDKQFSVDGVKQPKPSEVTRLLNIVFFTPEDLYLVKGAPALRRKFLDSEISQVSPTYRSDLQKYKKVLYQRNFLLKRAKKEKSLLSQTEIWDHQLLEFGSRLISKRLQFLQRLRPLARLIHRKLTGTNETLDIAYLGMTSTITVDNDLDDIKKALKQDLDKQREAEIERGITLSGPQRHDLQLIIEGVDTRYYASQGQQRTIALSLRLAELELIKAETGEYPVLLLDDVFSELDVQRRKLLLETVLKRVQTFLTTTDLKSLPELLTGVLKVHISTKKGGPECIYT